MVCYMYYTDVFVGTVNIENLKKALKAELKDSVQDDDLTQLKALASGLGFLAGLPACLCKTKKSVKEGLQKIYEELNKNILLISCNSKLNCDSCDSKLYPCKCCVIQSIKAVKECDCINGNKDSCHCDGNDVSCAKVLAGLEACLHLQCLQSDMNDICQCSGSECCKGKQCDGKSPSCDFCSNLKSQPTTGLGLSPPNPIRLAKRLDKFFGDSSSKSSSGCSCKCGTSGQSCCCLACDSAKCSSKNSCFCGSTSQCSCASKLQLPLSTCPCKTFCSKINDLKILSHSSEMQCCKSGKNCHCQVGSTCSTSPGQCCVTQLNGSKKQNFNHQSLKCLLRRLVKFFKDFESSSQPNCSKLCCELLCVLKMCESFKTFYDKRTAKECGTCKNPGKGAKGNCPSKGQCCAGQDPNCGSGSGFCSKCSECRQICDSKKFHNAFNELSKTLQYSSPCGQDLYRVLDDFLNFIRNVFVPNQDFIHSTVLKAVKDCPNCGKSGPNSSEWKACGCSSGSDCQACPKLLKDSKLMSILRHGYFSSYDSSSAKWESLCSPGSPKCCGSSPSCSCPQNCSSGSPSCPKDCCEKCPKRLCAKIFLGILPCLYYGLKILYDRSQDPVTWPDWQKISMNSDGTPSSDLGRFLYAWGYDLRPLISKKGTEFFSLLEKLFGSDSSGPLQKLSTLVTENYFTSNLISPPKDPKTPSTVRQMLLWLYGLRFHKHFSELVENCKSLCSPFGKSFNADALCYYIHASCFLLPVAIISLIEDSSSAQTAFSSSSDWESFSYPEDLSSLFEKLCEYARKIFVALAFLYYQCERVGSQAGWNDCAFGQKCSEKFRQISSTSVPSNSLSPSTSSSGCSCPNSKTYLCTAINKDTVHDHCAQGKCRGFPGSSSPTSVSCSDPNSVHPQSPAKPGSSTPKCTPCPHPLMRFLIDDSSDSDSKSTSKDPQNFRTPFHLPGIVPMGFKTEHLPSTPVKGEKLYHAIYGFCKDGFYPLTRLVQFILCVSQRPPETLGELFAFFKKFAGALNSKPDLSSTFVQWIEGEPGTYSGEDLKTALENLYGSQDSHWSSGTHKTSPTPASLYSLNDCEGPKGSSNPTCGKYLHALTEDVSGVFTPELCSMYLSWICYRAEKFYSEFQKFHTAAEKKFSCCKSCKKIVECPCALPFLYSQGFTFMSPSGLNCVDAQGQKHVKHGGTRSGRDTDPACTLKSCSQFLKQLEKVVNGQPFKDLLKVIDNFLWSIRFPFFFGFLYVWFFVLSYFFYVILIKLDTFHTGSHLHLPRSFKILPSTLFSDASSKL
ncbi:variant erythrocyte surface antigen-1 family protein, partial [Babesia divergens]